mgnify:CR=1 FL=1
MTKYLFLCLSFASFAQSPFYGKLRYYHMSTDNSEKLPDYAANAIAGEFGYKYKFKKYWTAEVSGSITSSFLNSSLVPTSRYEIGLFDQVDITNQNFLSRIEKMNLQFVKNKFKLTVGRQIINTPFINPQDGRMRPTAVGGIYGTYKNLEFACLYEISPRGTMGWSSVASSIGYYPFGVNTLGQKSNYPGQLSSRGILFTGLNKQLTKATSLKCSNTFVDQIATTAFIQMEHQQEIGVGKWIIGIQAMKQYALGNNLYDEKNQHAASWGLRFGYENNIWGSSINFNQISSEGRYLMPREWGKDPFFTFMPRERNEGLGGVNAIVVRSTYQIPKLGLKIQPSIGYFQLPNVDNYVLNKYGMPSYMQSNIDLTWDAKKILKGAEIQVLYVNKLNQGDTKENSKYILNKVDMSTWNFIVNYQW